MFGRQDSPLIARIRRAAELVRAFALLEDPGDRQPILRSAPTEIRPGGRAGADGARPAEETVRTVGPHPHSARLVRDLRRRRPGTIAPRPALCLTPVRPQPAGPMRRNLAAPRRLQSHRAGPHHRS